MNKAAGISGPLYLSHVILILFSIIQSNTGPPTKLTKENFTSSFDQYYMVCLLPVF